MNEGKYLEDRLFEKIGLELRLRRDFALDRLRV